MACRSPSSSLALFLSLVLLLSPIATALQVTPNSPCASFCLDSSGLDRSDPSASNTDGDEIVCNDDAYNSNTQGKKFQRCLTCLQESDFSRGDENDQDWFLCKWSCICLAPHQRTYTYIQTISAIRSTTASLAIPMHLASAPIPASPLRHAVPWKMP